VAETGAAAQRALTLLQGYRSTQVMYVMAKLGLADRLAKAPMTAMELASLVGTNPISLGRVLRLAAFLGLVSEIPNGRFELTEVGRLLSSSMEGSINANAIMAAELQYDAWSALLHSVQTGEPAFDQVHGAPFFDYLAANPDAQAVFDAGMSAGNEVFSRALGAAHDFSTARVVVDVGGGNGSVSAMILEHNPAIEAVIYDQPQVLEAADTYLTAAGVRSRCRLMPGDFFKSVPRGGDVYVLSNIVHDWDEARALRILQNCRAAMTETSVVLLIEAVMPEHGQPSVAATQDVNMLVLLTGRERTESEYRDLLKLADLRLTKVSPLWERESLIEARPLPAG
jgi:O-methyltransferase/methyltransferase family protein